MKTLFKSLFALSLLAIFASCSHEAVYTVESFVAFGKPKYEVQESAGSYKIAVYAYPAGKANTTVSFKVTDGAAKSGTNFSVTPADGVLTFEGDTLKYITVNVVDIDGVYTGNLDFSIEIVSATNDYTYDNCGKAAVTIVDEDHPLLSLFGEYTANGVVNVNGGYSYASWTMNISVYEGDVTRIWLDVIAPFFESSYYGSYAPHAEVYADVSNDKKTISIPYPQEVESTAAAAFGVDEHFVLYKFDGNDTTAPFLTDPGVIEFKLQEDGSYMTEDSYGFATESYVGDGWFYYYMSVFGGFNSSYPAFFIKK